MKHTDIREGLQLKALFELGNLVELDISVNLVIAELCEEITNQFCVATFSVPSSGKIHFVILTNTFAI